MPALRRPKSRWFFSGFINQEHNEPLAPEPRPNLKDLDCNQRTVAVLEHLSSITSAVTRGDPSAISRNTILSRVGVDSLMAVEIQGRIAAEIGIDIAIGALLADQSLWNIAEQVARRVM